VRENARRFIEQPATRDIANITMGCYEKSRVTLYIIEKEGVKGWGWLVGICTHNTGTGKPVPYRSLLGLFDTHGLRR
jgi:hypothetical protein